VTEETAGFHHLRKARRWCWKGVLRGGVLVTGSIDFLERPNKVRISFRESENAMTRITAMVIGTIIKDLRSIFQTFRVDMICASVSVDCEPEMRLRYWVMYCQNEIAVSDSVIRSRQRGISCMDKAIQSVSRR